MSYCPHCGAKIFDGALFCGNCGKSIAPVEAPAGQAGIKPIERPVETTPVLQYKKPADRWEAPPAAPYIPETPRTPDAPPS